MAEGSLNILTALQHADSMFPSGSVSFSWALEALVNRSIVTGPASMSDFLIAHVEGRWANLDRPILWHAHVAGDDLGEISRLDELVEAQSLAAEQRLGSTRMGCALLTVHNRLGTPLATEYLALVGKGRAFGHIPVVQGMLWRSLGLPAEQALAMAAHGLCAGLLGAAIRLSVVGHVDAQRIYAEMLRLIDDILGQPVSAPADGHSFIPQIEIASMNHETDETRLFVN